MAYYDFDGKITIDEVAAMKDISKINLAIPKLVNAKTALEQILREGSNSKGDTSAAIIEKSQELIKKINRMIENLNETQRVIKKTVNYYRELDKKVKRAIESASLEGK